MSSRVAYLERTERGIVTRRVRLVGQRSDEVFDLPASGSDQLDMAAASLWLSEHLPKDSPRERALDLLCLDAQGLTCAWVNTPSADPSVVRAMALAGSMVEGNEAGAGVLGIYASNPMDSSLQPLGADAPGGRIAKKGQQPASVRRRMGVLAGSDLAGRMLVDALDARGLGVGAACSLWHAMARAWDPAAGTSPHDAVATITTGVIIIEPGAAPRQHWVWSRHGELLAGGTARVASGTTGAPKLHESDASRLASDWLAWAAQLGLSPSRLVVVIPEPDPEGDTSAAFGAALGRAWPGAAIDLAVDPDPVGATLTRCAAAIDHAREKGDDPTDSIATRGTGGLPSLSARPGRQHRHLYLWAGGAIAAIAAALGVAAYRVGNHASDLSGQATSLDKSWRDELAALKLPTAPVPGLELDYLNAEIARREKELAPPEAGEATMPMREELETISLVVGIEDVELLDLSLSPTLGAKVEVTVADLTRAEELYDALSRVGGSALGPWSRQFSEVRVPPVNAASGANSPATGPATRVRCSFSAKWAVPPKPPAGGKTS
ncbi:MAG: hypothetical protein IT432_06675 [Phycisphaerales bacterium]|nr:hypothetical protein [Phycisphaerales bacterium]